MIKIEMNSKETYFKMFDLEVENETVAQIVSMLVNKKEPEKNYELLDIPTTYKVVYCDCGNSDLLDRNGFEAYYSDNYPNVLFIDPEAAFDTQKCIAHELIHCLQTYLYEDMSNDLDYHDRWHEKMANNLEYKVSQLILNSNIKFTLIAHSHDQIRNILKEIQIRDEDYFYPEEEENYGINHQDSIDLYFEENFGRHNQTSL